MGKLRMLAATLLVVAAACGRDGERTDEMAADTANAAESPELTTDLLSPIRSASLVNVDYGQTGWQQAAADDVRQYARTVAMDHRALIGALDSVARSRNTTLQETTDGRDLAQAIHASHAGLTNVEGPDFDLTFVRAQVESQRRLLNTIDQQLTPTATSPEMRQLLRDTRAMADAHLTRARQLLGTLLGEEVEPPPTGAQPGTQQPGAPAPIGQPQPTQPDTAPGT
jgi:predicted outer membrane protein